MDAAATFADALLAARLAASDPAALGGLLVRGAGGAADLLVEAFVDGLPAAAAVRRIPVSVDRDRLDGGLDIGATLASGRPVLARGLLSEAAGGLIVLPAAERIAPAVAARLAAALESGVDGRPIATLAFDDGADEDPAPAGALADRLAFHVSFEGLPLRLVDLATAAGSIGSDARPADASSGGPVVSDADLQALAEAADRLGVASPRTLLQAVAAARAAARLDDRDTVIGDDLLVAARLVLGPRAVVLAPPPPADDATPPPPDRSPDDPAEAGEPPADGPLADRIVAAATATLPPDVLAALAAAGGRAKTGTGRAGAERTTLTGGGRPIASRPGQPRGGSRLDIVETLRAAAPLQRFRAAPPPGCRLAVRTADFRIRRSRRPARTTTVFVVDASGSAALRRLGEAKGAVELILADCYVRRDRVAMIAFRGEGADLVLPPTGSLTAARRRLVDLAGGGGTPLAAAIDAAAALSDRIRRDGETPALVFLTDGQANVARDGTGGRARADADALVAAAVVRAAGVAVLLVDIADRPHPRARQLAAALGATYLPLPRADARAVASVVAAARPAASPRASVRPSDRS
ncbi:VWA domain-containing protein [Mongoliimonas terrestris]|uniref:VWA domain-containing protein n=1 Tax=Mongoliimonas terrestris TaxID=1709001 RepID=UPI00094954E9|nr:VWA domain-containing protein [Mongoliimonas terrestris]